MKGGKEGKYRRKAEKNTGVRIFLALSFIKTFSLEYTIDCFYVFSKKEAKGKHTSAFWWFERQTAIRQLKDFINDDVTALAEDLPTYSTFASEPKFSKAFFTYLL